MRLALGPAEAREGPGCLRCQAIAEGAFQAADSDSPAESPGPGWGQGHGRGGDPQDSWRMVSMPSRQSWWEQRPAGA